MFGIQSFTWLKKKCTILVLTAALLQYSLIKGALEFWKQHVLVCHDHPMR